MKNTDTVSDSVTLQQKILILITAAMMSTPIIFIRSGVAIALPKLMTQMGSMSYYSLIVVLYTISTAVSPTIAGKLADVIGRRNMCLTCVIGYMLGLAGCAFAPSFPVFIVSYLWLGLFFGSVFAMPQAVMGDCLPAPERPKYFGYMLSIQGVGTMIASLTAGYIIDRFGAQTIFLTMLPLLVITLILIAKNVSNARTAKVRKIDGLGILFLVLTLVPAMSIINFLGSRLSIVSPVTWIGILFSIVMAILFYRHEKKAPEPLIYLAMFNRHGFRVAALMTIFVATVLPINQNYLSLFSQGALGLSATTASVLTLPRSVGTMILPSFFGVYMAKKTGNFRKAFTFCSIFAILGSAVLLIMNNTNVVITYLLACACCAISLAGAGNYPAAAFAQRELDKSEYGMASGTLASLGTIAGSFAGAIMGAILNKYWDVSVLIPSALREVLTPAQAAQLSSNQILKNQAALNAISESLPRDILPLFDDMIQNMHSAMSSAMVGIAIVGMAFGLGMLVTSVLGAKEK